MNLRHNIYTCLPSATHTDERVKLMTYSQFYPCISQQINYARSCIYYRNGGLYLSINVSISHICNGQRFRLMYCIDSSPFRVKQRLKCDASSLTTLLSVMANTDCLGIRIMCQSGVLQTIHCIVQAYLNYVFF